MRQGPRHPRPVSVCLSGPPGRTGGDPGGLRGSRRSPRLRRLGSWLGGGDVVGALGETWILGGNRTSVMEETRDVGWSWGVVKGRTGGLRFRSKYPDPRRGVGSTRWDRPAEGKSRSQRDRRFTPSPRWSTTSFVHATTLLYSGPLRSRGPDPRISKDPN